MPGIVLVVNIVSNVDRSINEISKTFSAFPKHVNAGYEKLLELAKEVYALVNKSWLRKIVDYFKDKLYDHLIKPLKDKLFELIKQMMPKWLKAALGAVKKFWNKVKYLFKLIYRGIKRTFKWLWRITKTAFRIFNKVFRPIIKMI